MNALKIALLAGASLTLIACAPKQVKTSNDLEVVPASATAKSGCNYKKANVQTASAEKSQKNCAYKKANIQTASAEKSKKNCDYKKASTATAKADCHKKGETVTAAHMDDCDDPDCPGKLAALDKADEQKE